MKMPETCVTYVPEHVLPMSPPFPLAIDPPAFRRKVKVDGIGLAPLRYRLEFTRYTY